MADSRRLASAFFWAATWGIGVAVGVALGGWLTVVGGVGTPGVESLDIGEDLFLLPLVVGGVVFALHLLGQAVVGSIRRSRSASDSDSQDDAHEQG